MAKGFKKNGKFVPTGNKSKSSLKKSDVRKKQTYDKLPENFSLNDLIHRDSPHNYSDSDIDHHAKLHKLQADKLGDEIREETPAMIKTIENLKGYHEDAVRDADDLIESLRNTNHEGHELPMEYLDITSTEIDNFIRDWSNVTSDSYGSLERGGSQNTEVVRQLSELKTFKNKIDAYDKESGETYN